MFFFPELLHCNLCLEYPLKYFSYHQQVGGESAGGIDSSLLALSPHSAGLFTKVFPMSGATGVQHPMVMGPPLPVSLLIARYVLFPARLSFRLYDLWYLHTMLLICVDFIIATFGVQWCHVFWVLCICTLKQSAKIYTMAKICNDWKCFFNNWYEQYGVVLGYTFNTAAFIWFLFLLKIGYSDNR